ncbi:SMC family ATPase [bacterium]|nr:SMC family ATPase [bacterium]
MVPIKIKLENFRSFSSAVEIPLDFSPLFCIVGDNGAGKSSIVEAILWALFGISRSGKKSKDVIRTGKKYAEVEFDFEMWGEKYRIIRRQNRSSGGILKVLNLVNDQFIPLASSNRKSDAQMLIEKILGTDFTGLRLATVFVQNESSLFSTMKPHERRKNLAQILGIEKFQRIRDAASRKYNRISTEIEIHTATRDNIDEKLATLKDYSDELGKISAEIEKMKDELTEKSRKLRDTELKMNELKSLEKQREKILKTYRDLQGEKSQLEKSLLNKRQNLAQLEEILSHREEILAQKAEYDALTRQDEEMSSNLSKVLNIQKELSRAEKEFYQKKTFLEKQRSEVSAKIEATEKQVEKYEDELKDEKTVSEKVEQLKSAREMLDDLLKSQSKIQELEHKREIAQMRIEQEERNLREQIEQHRAEIDVLREKLTRRTELEEKITAIDEKIAECEKIEKDKVHLQEKLLVAEKNLSAIEQERQNFLKILSERKRQMDFISDGEVARCPRCGTELTEEHRKSLLEKLASEIEEIEKSIENTDTRRNNLNEQIANFKKNIEKFDTKILGCKKLQNRRNKLSEELSALRKISEEIERRSEKIREIEKKISEKKFAGRWRSEISKIDRLIEKENFLPEALDEAEKLVDELAPFERKWQIILDIRNRKKAAEKELEVLRAKLLKLEQDNSLDEISQRIEKLNSQLKGISYNSDRHSEIRARLQELKKVPEKIFALQDAEKKYPELTKKIENIIDRLSRVEREMADAVKEEKNLSDALTERDNLQSQMEKLSAEVETINAEIEDKNSLKIEMEGTQKSRLELLNSKKSLSTKISLLKKESALYKSVVDICGPLGIQDWLMRNYLASLEEDANEILESITDDALSVRLIPEKDEKLTVRISDRLGERDYSSYSGGEEFRIDFALRLALSRLLANRSGFPLRTLIIDEGFGSQDEKGLEKLVETIYEVQSQFDRIIVITHLEVLRDKFPAKIVVRKTDAGSTVQVLS